MKKISKNLQKELVRVNQYPKLPLKSHNAVVVLAAEEIDMSGENGERILAGLDLAKKIGGAVKIIFLGTQKHNASLKEYLGENKIKVPVSFPTESLQDSSQTQVKHLAVFLRKNPVESLLIVSHSYHIPRLKRYCQKYLASQKYDFCPVGKISQQTEQAEKEIEKIIKYTRKGDLVL